MQRDFFPLPRIPLIRQTLLALLRVQRRLGTAKSLSCSPHGPQLYKQGSKTSSMPARLRASLAVTLVHVRLELCEARTHVEAGIPLGMHDDTMLHRPHDCCVAPLALFRVVARLSFLSPVVWFCCILEAAHVGRSSSTIQEAAHVGRSSSTIQEAAHVGRSSSTILEAAHVDRSSSTIVEAAVVGRSSSSTIVEAAVVGRSSSTPM